MLCIKCAEQIDKTKYDSEKYCSKKCATLYLKSQYKKRNREKINAYNRSYRKLGARGHRCDNRAISAFCDRNYLCAKCGTTKNLHACHIKPRWAGGEHKDNLIRLCQKCHHQFDVTLKDFWAS